MTDTIRTVCDAVADGHHGEHRGHPGQRGAEAGDVAEERDVRVNG